MSWKLLIRTGVKREIRKLHDAILSKIMPKIIGLKENPFPEGSVKLKAIEGYRIRVGEWRILYEVYQHEQMVLIFGVHRRDKAYR